MQRSSAGSLDLLSQACLASPAYFFELHASSSSAKQTLLSGKLAAVQLLWIRIGLEQSQFEVFLLLLPSFSEHSSSELASQLDFLAKT